MIDEQTQYSAQPAGEASTVPEKYGEGRHPWRRFFARAIDNNINGFLAFFVLAIIAAIVAPQFLDRFLGIFEGVGGRILDIMLTIFLAIFLNALLIGFTGRSLGKFLMGVYVAEADGSKLGYGRALRREFKVWFQGLGFGIPLVNIFFLMHSFNDLTEKGITAWDQDMKTQVLYRPGGALQYLLVSLGFVIWLGVIVLTVSQNMT